MKKESLSILLDDYTERIFGGLHFWQRGVKKREAIGIPKDELLYYLGEFAGAIIEQQIIEEAFNEVLDTEKRLEEK